MNNAFQTAEATQCEALIARAMLRHEIAAGHTARLPEESKQQDNKKRVTARNLVLAHVAGHPGSTRADIVRGTELPRHRVWHAVSSLVGEKMLTFKRSNNPGNRMSRYWVA